MIPTRKELRLTKDALDPVGLEQCNENRQLLASSLLGILAEGALFRSHSTNQLKFEFGLKFPYMRFDRTGP